LEPGSALEPADRRKLGVVLLLGGHDLARKHGDPFLALRFAPVQRDLDPMIGHHRAIDRHALGVVHARVRYSGVAELSPRNSSAASRPIRSASAVATDLPSNSVLCTSRVIGMST